MPFVDARLFLRMCGYIPSPACDTLPEPVVISRGYLFREPTASVRVFRLYGLPPDAPSVSAALAARLADPSFDVDIPPAGLLPLGPFFPPPAGRSASDAAWLLTVEAIAAPHAKMDATRVFAALTNRLAAVGMPMHGVNSVVERPGS
jgi:hypothetical protein